MRQFIELKGNNSGTFREEIVNVDSIERIYMVQPECESLVFCFKDGTRVTEIYKCKAFCLARYISVLDGLAAHRNKMDDLMWEGAGDGEEVHQTV